MHFTRLRPEGCEQEMYDFISGKRGEDPGALIRDAVIGVAGPGTLDKRIEVDVDATWTTMENGRLGFRIDKLRRLVLTYEDTSGD